jgi:hypothetical protein
MIVTLALAGVATRADEPLTPAAPAAAPGDPLRVTLDNGATLELVALTRANDPDAPWWAPDGTVLRDAKWPRTGYGGGDREGVYTLYVRAAAPDANAPPGRFRTQAKGITLWGGAGSPEAGYTFALDTLPASETADVGIGFSAGPWTAVRAIDREEDRKYPDGRDSVKGNIIFAPLAERDGALVLSVTDNLPDTDVRLVAFDTGGKEYPAGAVRSSSGEHANAVDLRVTWGSFKLPRERLDRIEFQVRPFAHARFTGLSLRPGKSAAHPAAVRGSLRDQPPGERRLYGNHWLKPEPFKNSLRLIALAADVQIDARWDELAKVGALENARVTVGMRDPTVGEALERIARQFGEGKVRAEYVEDPELKVKKFVLTTSPPTGL